jgi:acetyl-CoA carboxylase biotin carboxyl carrier protein|tara:strand:+ start:47 stop:472 length:426 start_codon:yes stop_codon:yes gene_type:complete
MKIDKDKIKELTNCLDELGLSELEYAEKDLKIKVSKWQHAPSDSSSKKLEKDSSIKSKEDKISSGIKIISPIIGTAYHSPEPGAKKFIEIGKKIKKGDTIMIVEAMKTMNHVPSTADGVVKEICVEDGQPVEFGQTIIILN